MPFNSTKTIKLNDFLGRVHTRLQAHNNPHILTFFEIFLQDSLANDLVKEAGAKPGLAELELLPGDFDVIYDFAANKLRDAAGRNLSEVHLDVYQNAQAVSQAFCDELNEFFECSGEDGLYDLIPIKSFVEMMGLAGCLKP
ncbi:MAG: hypothetical protein WCT19_03050 [Candidatus Paceibacterota bacterium]